ncbi:MAG: hypothetical protein ACI4WW_01460 [Candidatus Coprovivens sp.]
MNGAIGFSISMLSSFIIASQVLMSYAYNSLDSTQPPQPLVHLYHNWCCYFSCCW